MKMTHRYIYIIGISFLVLLPVSCGQKHKAASLADDFVERYALQPEQLTDRDYCHFDSTHRLNDSLVAELQQQHKPLFKKDIPYPAPKAGRMLYLIRMNYTSGGDDTLVHTFYIDEHMQHIVAFK